jgi:hypothetical protein
VKILILAALLGQTLSSAAIAGPFGFDPGMPISKLTVVEDLGDEIYIVNAPSPDKDFVSYMILATPEDGLCKVIATGRTMTGDEDGSQVRAKMGAIINELNGKYGKNQTFDSLQETVWTKPKDWGISLYLGFRTLATFWTKQIGSNLPADTTSVGVQAEATGAEKTNIAMIYEFANFAACSKR